MADCFEVYPGGPTFTPDGAPCTPDTGPGLEEPAGDPGADERCRLSGGVLTGGVCVPVPGALPGGGPPRGDGGEEDGGFEGWPVFGGSRRPSFDIPGAPRFRAPRFTAPTLEEARGEPGYAFAREEGLRGLEQSASARGLLNTGGLPKQLFSWADKFAEQNYGNVFNRSLSAFDRLYRGAWDEFQPQLDEWRVRSGAGVRAGELGFAREWEEYLAQLQQFQWMNPSADAILGYGAGD